MPWRGPVRGSKLLADQFPSLGWQVAADLDELFWWQPLTGTQVRFLVEHYRLDPTSGRRLVRRSQYMGPKGCGKSPLMAKVCVAELRLDVRFDGWSATGDPVGRPWAAERTPWVQLLGTAKDQADNTYAPLVELLTEHDGEVADTLGLDVADSRVLWRANSRAKIERVTTAAGTRTGQPITFAGIEEAQLLTDENRGKSVVKVVRENLSKADGSSMQICNAPDPALDSVAQATDEAFELGEPGVFVLKPQAAPKVASLANRRDTLRGLRQVYVDAAWVDVERVYDDMRDPETTEAKARANFLNEIVPTGDRAWEPDAWRARADTAKGYGDRDLVALGFDGSRRFDSTALWACRLEDRHFWRIGVWERPVGTDEDDWEVPGTEVDEAVERAFDTLDVAMMFGDPPHWEPYIDRWCGARPDQVRRWYTNQTKQMCWAVRRFDEAIRNGGLSHDDDPVLNRHVNNAFRRPRNVRDDDGRFLWDIRKASPKSANKIDAVVAAIVADQAAAAAVARGALNPTGQAWFY